MVYIDAQGRRHDRKPVGVSSIPDFFWAVVNFIVLFFSTLFSFETTEKVMKGRPIGNGGGSGGGSG
eukprot:CAMPEP_0201488852 /NCGR_PEP_ID=MMETSP0151_2-20130828/19872_1 /ASSEMBLY_ACC=CAM_ASM_000257 /TAXON_ID=200890 /ORGANISM="Paramoeba atlantica, Strain 621/1 / CCAP 1560/9" /LENGTH=65 /DNA_ID=CAMNT_0047874237 /DNA_START=136 /DNA_END=330 /DNA_ORIENTATION=+